MGNKHPNINLSQNLGLATESKDATSKDYVDAADANGVGYSSCTLLAGNDCDLIIWVLSEAVAWGTGCLASPLYVNIGSTVAIYTGASGAYMVM